MQKTQELIEAPLTSHELAVRYRELCEDARFSKVPAKIELDRRVEAPIVTAAGLCAPDLAWASAGFMHIHRGETPFMWAPELCIEVVSPANSRKELGEKTEAYLAAGAEEVP